MYNVLSSQEQLPVAMWVIFTNLYGLVQISTILLFLQDSGMYILGAKTGNETKNCEGQTSNTQGKLNKETILDKNEGGRRTGTNTRSKYCNLSR